MSLDDLLRGNRLWAADVVRRNVARASDEIDDRREATVARLAAELG